jgi:hypothetical protein
MEMSHVKLWSLLGNSQQLDGGAMLARPIIEFHPALRAGPLAASGFVPDESVATEY